MDLQFADDYYTRRRKAIYDSHAASNINAAAGINKPHKNPRNATVELLNIA